jgi:hypothetical protein
VQLDDVPGDGEPDPQPAARPRRRRALLEGLEDARQQRRLDAAAGVVDAQLEPPLPVAAPPHGDAHQPARIGELERVRDEVDQHLLDSRRVPHRRRQPRLVVEDQLDAALLGHRPHRLDHARGERPELRRRGRDAQRPGVDARHVEEIVEQAGLRAGVALDHRERAIALGRGHVGAPEERRPAEERRERRAQLVAHRRQQLVATVARLLGLPRLVDRQPEEAPEPHHQRAIVVAVAARLRRHQQHAERRPALRRDRRGHERAQPGLAHGRELDAIPDARLARRQRRLSEVLDADARPPARRELTRERWLGVRHDRRFVDERAVGGAHEPAAARQLGHEQPQHTGDEVGDGRGRDHHLARGGEQLERPQLRLPSARSD